jgi:hypothetical protein
MTTLAQRLFFGAGRSNDQEQLLRLFWSRANLKQQFEKLRNENFALSERLRREEMLKLRLQQGFEQLESMLANPATAASAITYYQLKDLWHRCSLRLAAVSSDLWKAHYEVEYRKHVGLFRRELYKSLSTIQQELHEVSHRGEELSDQILKLREARGNSYGFWNFFRRRALTANINLKRIQRRAITMRLGELTEQIQLYSNAQPPEFGGLSTAIKRSVNLTVIAHAQELYLHFADRELAAMACAASTRQVADVQYGDSAACREISRYMAERSQLLQIDSDFEGRVQTRVAYLAECVVYNREEDSMPNAESLRHIHLLTAEGEVCGQVALNVLTEEYWDMQGAIVT